MEVDVVRDGLVLVALGDVVRLFFLVSPPPSPGAAASTHRVDPVLLVEELGPRLLAHLLHAEALAHRALRKRRALDLHQRLRVGPAPRGRVVVVADGELGVQRGEVVRGPRVVLRVLEEADRLAEGQLPLLLRVGRWRQVPLRREDVARLREQRQDLVLERPLRRRARVSPRSKPVRRLAPAPAPRQRRLSQAAVPAGRGGTRARGTAASAAGSGSCCRPAPSWPACPWSVSLPPSPSPRLLNSNHQPYFCFRSQGGVV